MRNLAVLLGQTEAEVAAKIYKLEKHCGFPSEDVRLLAKNQAEVRTKIAQLGLDPNDTTGQELYHALLAKYGRDIAAVDRALGISAASSWQQKTAKIQQLLNHTMNLHGVWVPKTTAAKVILLAHPPKKLMKLLGYRSAASLLKREPISAVILAAEQIESASWHKVFEAKLAKLPTTSYELKLPQIVSLNPKLAKLSAPQIVVSQSAGAVATWPNSGDMPSLTMALLLADGLEQLGEQQDPQSLSSAHVALNWWNNAEHLVFDAGGMPVSLNFKDVAVNHLNSSVYGQHVSRNGHQQAWAKLMNGYKRYVDELPVELAAAKQQVKSFRPQLALESIEIYE